MLLEPHCLSNASAADAQSWPSVSHNVVPAAAAMPRRVVGGRSVPDYYLSVPANVDPNKRALVVVHGISRNADEHLQAFREFSDATGRVLVAPVFSESEHRRYQRLGRDTVRADVALDDLLRRVQGATGVATDTIDLFGFSAGAQFAHRFAMLYPQRVGRLALSSAGWFTDPGRDERFPYGIGTQSRMGRTANEKLTQFLGIPMLVMVGEGDVERDRGLRKNAQLDEHQGYSRVERAGRWVRSLRRVAEQRRVKADITLRILPDCGHSFLQCVERGALVDTATEWLQR